MVNFALGILIIIFVVITRRVLKKYYFLAQFNLAIKKSEYDELLAQRNKIGKEALALKEKLQQMVILYDITKKICNFLAEENIINLFKEELRKSLNFADCQFVTSEKLGPEYSGYKIVKMNINNENAGYLVASGISDEDNEKFNILAHQFELGIKRAILYERVQELAITDNLTGLLSRRYWFERLSQEIERSKRLSHNLVFFMIDIDGFKYYNDTFGHLVGDAILKEIAKRIKDNLRQIDLICRFGGDEFCAVLVEMDKASALVIANRIITAVREKPIVAYDEGLKISLSIGISVFGDDSTNPQILIQKADRALYRAKELGKNQACIFSKK